MPQDPRIDAYIAKAAPFAQPILTHVRALVHATIPGLGETIKWSMPHFVYKDKNLAGFAAFKAHAAVMIHGDGRQGDAMGQYGKIASLADLPDDKELAAKLLDAKARIDQAGTALKPKAAKPAAPKAEIAMPDDFARALDAMQGTRERFDAMPPGARREYLEWIVGAKRDETRASRIAKACEQISEGKKLNWKYESC
jgi:uncharacterized protein YdeI (YjbR/CyaY-like superfamily)